MTRTWGSKTLISVIAGVGLLYVALVWLSCDGYGYAGYDDYDTGASFWYFGDVDTFHSRSVRAGSRGGPGVTGGGK